MSAPRAASPPRHQPRSWLRTVIDGPLDSTTRKRQTDAQHNRRDRVVWAIGNETTESDRPPSGPLSHRPPPGVTEAVQGPAYLSV